MKDVVLRVEGMVCGHCEIAVQDAVRKLPGIKRVKASKRKKQVAVAFDETKTTLEAIKTAINNTGYRVVDG